MKASKEIQPKGSAVFRKTADPFQRAGEVDAEEMLSN